MLLARPGELVTREEIQQKLWPSGTFVDFENGLNSAVNRLRDVLGDSAEQPRFIQTIPRHGYRFLAPVERMNRHAPDRAPLGVQQVQVEKGQTIPGSSRVWPWSASLAAAAVLASGALAAWQHYRATKAVANFKARDWALIASFENRTGNPEFDGTMEYALARELSNSQYVTVVSPERVGDALRLMKKPPDTRIDAALGREICLRDGDIRVLLTGRIERLGTTYVLSAQLVNPALGVTVASLTEEDPADSQMAAAVRRLSNRVREMLGEKAAQIQQSEKRLEKVTTPSLHALQLYSQADALMRRPENKQAVAAELLKQAIADDPNFASAQLLLGYTYSNRGNDAQARPEFQRALELADTASDRERLFIQASYYDIVQKDAPKAIEAYETLLQLFPDHYWAGNNLQQAYKRAGRWDERWRLSVQLADLRPDDPLWNTTAACELYLNSNRDSAKPYIERVRAIEADPKGSFTAEVEMLPVLYSWVHGDVPKARAQFLQLEKSNGEFGYPFLLWSLGELAEADRRLLRKSTDDPRENIFLGMGSYIRGDLLAAKKYFQKYDDDELGLTSSVVMGRSGLWDRVETKMRGSPPDAGIEVLQGELAIARGHTKRGTVLLEKGLEGLRTFPVGAFYLGSETLARAYEKQGDLDAALRVLKRASDAKQKAAYSCAATGGMSGEWWLRDELQLADLYRKIGRVPEAEQVENELRKMLIYADADHPIVLALKKPKRSGAVATSR